MQVQYLQDQLSILQASAVQDAAQVGTFSISTMAAWQHGTTAPVAQVKRLEEESAEALAQAEKAKQAANEAAEHALQDTWHM